ncbi:MAG: hypothetical protein IID32_08605, partial [Planctomycetes bacterium]|nr:hypothetical protein [Planctomycetota bacterium]
DLSNDTTPDRNLLNFDPLTGQRVALQAFALSELTSIGGDEFLVTTADDNQPDTVMPLFSQAPLSSYIELLTSVNMDRPTRGLQSNAFVIFDYRSDTDFKFIGISAKTNKLQIGRRTDEGWIIDAKSNARIRYNQNYDLKVVLNGQTASLVVDGQRAISHTFDTTLDDGQIGVATQNSITRFSNFQVLTLPAAGF